MLRADAGGGRVPPRDRARRARGGARPARADRPARRALAALASPPSGRPDRARLAHHAEAADDREAVLAYAPAAGERAAALGSHREAAAQFARALRHAEALEPARRAELLERVSYEYYLIDCIADAIAARRAALAEHSAAGDRPREGDAHRWLSRLAWFAGDNATAEDEARLAIELLEPLAPAPSSPWPTATWPSCGCSRATAHGATHGASARSRWPSASTRPRSSSTRSTTSARAEMVRGLRGGHGEARAQPRLALDAGLEEHVARAYTNLASIAVDARDYARADALSRRRDRVLRRARPRLVALLHDRLPGARRARPRRLDDAAPRRATAVLEDRARRRARADHAAGRPGPPARAPRRARPVVAARRGAASWRRAPASCSASRRPPSRGRRRAGSRARPTDRGRDGRVALALALVHQHDAWVVGELCVWRRRAGHRRRRLAASRSPSRSGSSSTASPRRRRRPGRRSAARTRRARRRPRRRRAHAAPRARRAAAPRAPARRPRASPDAARARAARPARGPARRDAREPGGPDARASSRCSRYVAEGLRNAEIAAPPVPVGEDGRPPRLGDPPQARGPDAQPGRRRGRAARHGRKIGSPSDDARRTPWHPWT